MKINKHFESSGQYRQGDVMIIPANISGVTRELPAKNGKVILAEGEVTGHFHSMLYGPAVMFKDESTGGKHYLKITKKTDLTHDEHEPITLEPSTKRILRQRQYCSGEVNRVRD